MNIMTKLNVRQKVMLALTILAAAFLAWQIYNFVHGNTSPSASITPAPAPAMQPVSNVAPPPVVRPLPVNNNLAPGALTNQQREYLNLVREYQLTKMKRQILEEEAAVASAQKRISANGGANILGNSDSFSSGEVAGGYQLSYLDRQAGQWTATISQGSDQFKEVHVGTRLSDGARVIAINNRGVVIHPLQGKNKLISFQGSVNVDGSAAAYSVRAKKTAAPSAEPAANNDKNAKIAKILGITTPPAAPVAAPVVPEAAAPVAPAPVAAPALEPVAAPAPPVTDIPAAPQTLAPPAAAPAPQAPAAQPEAAEPAQPHLGSTPASTPVSVKELRAHKAYEATNLALPAPVPFDANTQQISWQQTVDLQAAALNNN